MLLDNTVYVTLRDISKLGELLDAVVKAGSNSINSIQFDVADRKPRSPRPGSWR